MSPEELAQVAADTAEAEAKLEGRRSKRRRRLYDMTAAEHITASIDEITVGGSTHAERAQALAVANWHATIAVAKLLHEAAQR